jgi:LysR family transcriptional regulator, nod-box dependent transcriptional activator
VRFHQFDLNLLVYLDALLTERSVSKAAVRVHITQPSMSEALARLRDYFGDDLLVSVEGRRMVLTSAAQSMVVPVRNILMQVRAVATTTKDFDPATSDRCFSIMASDYMAEILIKTLVTGLQECAPGIQVEIRRLNMEDRRQILRAELDLLIAPEKLVFEHLPSEPLWQDPQVWILWSRNPQAGKKLTLEQFAKMDHVGSAMDYHIAELISRSGVERRIVLNLPDICMIPRAIQGSNRVATVPRRLARIYARQCSLRLYEPTIDLPPLVETMQWHSRQESDAGLLWLRSYIKLLTSGL